MQSKPKRVGETKELKAFAEKAQQYVTPPTEEQRKQRAVNGFIHELAILTLAETPIKSTVRNRTQSLRGEIIYNLKPEHRELYLAGRDVLLDLARALANAETPEQLSGLLAAIQEHTIGGKINAA